MADAFMTVQVDGMRAFARDLKRADAGMAKEFTKAMKKGGDIIAVAARSNASWSTRIPNSIRVGASAKAVYIRAGGARAPHARIMEQGGRHPVFGNRQVWVDQPARPYMEPAKAANMNRLVEEFAKAIDSWSSSAGFR